MQARALSAHGSVKTRSFGVDFIVLSLRCRMAGSDKVITFIDALTAALEKEGKDDAKKEYCAKQFDESDDKKKVIEMEAAGPSPPPAAWRVLGRSRPAA